MRDRGLEGNHALQAHFNLRLQAILARHGKTVVGWDEILKYQLDARHSPCNFVELMPRLKEHLKAIA